VLKVLFSSVKPSDFLAATIYDFLRFSSIHLDLFDLFQKLGGLTSDHHKFFLSFLLCISLILNAIFSLLINPL
jgi:hypothetical protein